MAEQHVRHRVPKKYLVAGIVLALAGVFVYAACYEPRYRGLISISDRSLLFAHRGYGNHAPDNSIEGARMAMARGLDGVDVDAQMSRDGEIVIFHDVSLERFTTGEGRVDAHDLETLQQYDLADKFGEGFSGVYMRTLEDFVREVTPRAYLMVELKVASASDTGIESRVHEILEKYDAYERVYVSSFNPIVLYRLKQIDSRIRTVFIFMDSGWDPARIAATKEEDRVSLPWYLQAEWTRKIIRKIIRPDAVSVNHTVDESVIDSLIAKGHPVFLWPVNEAADIEWALETKPYGLVTDEPPRAQTVQSARE